MAYGREGIWLYHSGAIILHPFASAPRYTTVLANGLDLMRKKARRLGLTPDVRGEERHVPLQHLRQSYFRCRLGSFWGGLILI